MFLSDNRYEEIKRIVVGLFIEYGISTLPIDVFELAKKMGVKVVPYSKRNNDARQHIMKKSEDGFSVEKTIGDWYIFYNDSIDSKGRINNTIMHEIGHIALDHTEDSELAESEVKFFAKYALVPPVLVHDLNITSKEAIVEKFNVSYQAAGFALNYYRKWNRKRCSVYTNYEEKLLYLFKK